MIVGLGNPGPEYAETRHNAGFMVVDRLLERFRKVSERRFHQSKLYEAQYRGSAVICFKPGTFMNRSGAPTTAAVGEYEIARGEFLVVHDDLDLPVGKLRFRKSGSSGGHRGIDDLIRHVGAGFQRLRFGIGRPSSHLRVEDYVLEPIAATEIGAIEAGVQRAVEGCLCWLSNGMQRAMNEFNADLASEQDQDESQDKKDGSKPDGSKPDGNKSDGNKSDGNNPNGNGSDRSQGSPESGRSEVGF